jgi:hypothetical protein
VQDTGSENQIPAPATPQRGQPDDGTATRPRPAQVPRTTELVAAGSIFARMVRGFFALWAEVDDAERQYGPKLYESMMNDPIAGSSVDVVRQAAIRLPTLSPPKELQTPPGREPTEDEADAARICAACNRALHHPTRPLVEALYEWTYGLIHDKLAEVVLAKVAEGPDRGRFTFGAFKFKPRESWRYVVDPYGNVGFVAGRLPPGELPPDGSDGVMVPGTGGNAVLLEPDRFAVFSWATRDSDPRCRPILRRAYNAWNLKQRTWPEKLKGDVQFGTPSVAAIMPEEMEDPEPDENAGKTLPDGTPVSTAEDLLLWNLVQLANGSAAAFPFGTTINVVESSRDGASLNASIELYNREIAAAILHAPRTTQEAKNGSKADSESSGDVTELLVDLIRAMLAGLIRNLLRTLVRLNDGPDAAARKVPEVGMGEVGDQDLPALIGAFANWVKAGAPTPTQLAEIDHKIGLMPRKAGEPSLADLSRSQGPAAGPASEGGERGEEAKADPGDEPQPPTKPKPDKKAALK